MRFGWRKPYELRGSRTVLRDSGVKLLGSPVHQFPISKGIGRDKKNVTNAEVVEV